MRVRLRESIYNNENLCRSSRTSDNKLSERLASVGFDLVESSIFGSAVKHLNKIKCWEFQSFF